MFCIKCGTNLPDEAHFCSACGREVVASASPRTSVASLQAVPPQSLAQSAAALKRKITDSSLAPPVANPEWRKKLLDLYLGYSNSQNLSEWLRDIGVDATGDAETKEARIREHTKYISMPAEEFPEQTLNYLQQMKKMGVLDDICEDLGLDYSGSNDSRIRRIYREVGYQEGWLSRYSRGTPITRDIISPVIEWSPILHTYDYEKDCYPEFIDEMSEIFGSENVHAQHPIAHGTTLKIDFHLGHPQNGGVGVEFKMPTNNAELQRGLGQMDQYVSRYHSELVVVLYRKFLNDAQVQLFVDELGKKNIECIQVDS